MKADPDDLAPLANRFRLAVMYGLVLVAIVFAGFIAEFAWRHRPEAPSERTANRTPFPNPERRPRPKRSPVTTTAVAPASPDAASDRSVDIPMTGPDPAPLDPATTRLSPEKLAPQAGRLPATLPIPGGPGSADTPNVQGVVRLIGTPPPELALPMDPGCGKLHTNKPTTRFYLVGEDNGLADVLVHVVAGLPQPSFARSTQPVLLDQVGCQYTPYVLAIHTGQPLVVRNSDPLLHIVHPTPAVEGNPESVTAQPPGSPDLVFVFRRPELFLRFKSDIHPWMFAYVSVLDHSFFAITDTDGRFSLPRLPPGEYQLQAIHRKAGAQLTDKFTLRPGERITFDLQLKVPASPIAVQGLQ